MSRLRTSEYFGGTKKLEPEDQPLIRHSLTFDNQNISNIAQLIFNGMKITRSKPGELTKDDLRAWTKAIMAKKYPNKEFSEEWFEKGFQKLDMDKDGTLNIEDLKIIVLEKVKRENLYAEGNSKHR